MSAHLFHASSREALAQVRTSLASTENAALATTADELFAVVGLLSTERSLRRILADSSSDPARRAGLAADLFGAKVSAATLTVLTAAASASWSSPREFVDGIEYVARVAVFTKANLDGTLDSVEDELFRLGRIIAAQSRLDQVLSDLAGNTEGKLALLHQLLDGKAEVSTLALVENLIAFPRGRGVVSGLEELAAFAAAHREQSVAVVRTASALSEAQQDRLSATLERIYARPIALHIEVDPTVLGGLVIKVGDEVIDGSAAGRLATVRRTLAG
jgi:F-type H+-transporting ATPase subunit delta